MASSSPPTIISPNGGETIVNRSMEIKWYSPVPSHPDDVPVWYELLFTDAFEHDKKNEWKQIASTPANVSSFNWRIPFSVKSAKCRFGIRSRDARGTRTEIAHIADDFEIKSVDLVPPAVVSPIAGSTYRLGVPIVFDHEAVRSTISQRALYQVYYSSEELEIDWTPVSEEILFDSGAFTWDVRDIAPSNDYRMKFNLMDETGVASPPVFVDDLTIYPMDYVILDTTPPKGAVSAQSATNFISQRDIVVKLSAFDEATGVKSVVLQQKNADGTDVEGAEEIEQEFTKIQTWHIQGDDGLKFLEVKFKDFGGNILIGDEGERFFRKFVSDGNAEVSAFTVDGDDIWSAFDSSTFPLYRNNELMTNFSSTATSLIFFDNILHIGIKDADDKGLLQKFQDEKLTDLQQFTDLDSVINGMAVFGNDLYLGLRNGELHKFDKTTFTLVKTFDKQIKGLFANVVSLYIFEENTDKINIYDGTNFTTASLLNGSQ
tara:strand:+ start:5213 stop:6676 length:1464 start_codon:yes stop_codon:yes gene_type:complete